MTRLALLFLCLILALLGCIHGFMSSLKLHGRPFSRPQSFNLKMSSSLVFLNGKLTDEEEDDVGSVYLGRSAVWPLYWCPYIVAGHRFVNATMESDSGKKRKILEDLEIIYHVVDKECYSHTKTLADLLADWRPPSSTFLTSRKPTLEAAHLTILVDLFENWFQTSVYPSRHPLEFNNAFLCRMYKMIEVLHPYLARDEKDVKGTPFEQVGYALAGERFDELECYCEMATKDKNITTVKR